MTTALKMQHDRDPRDVIMENLPKGLAAIQPMGARVLVATYMRGDKTAGGIFIPDKSRAEDEYQGRIGLVLKMGPLAFVEDDNHRWGDVKPRVGDWVMMAIGDARRASMGKQPTRFVEDVHIQAIVPDPDMFY